MGSPDTQVTVGRDGVSRSGVASRRRDPTAAAWVCYRAQRTYPPNWQSSAFIWAVWHPYPFPLGCFEDVFSATPFSAYMSRLGEIHDDPPGFCRGRRLGSNITLGSGMSLTDPAIRSVIPGLLLPGELVGVSGHPYPLVSSPPRPLLNSAVNFSKPELTWNHWCSLLRSVPRRNPGVVAWIQPHAELRPKHDTLRGANLSRAKNTC